MAKNKDNDKFAFNQSYQQVNQQTNIVGNVGSINFGAVENKAELVAELRNFLSELNKATKAGKIPDETSIDVESHVKKAIIEIEKHEPKKKSVIDHLEGAKSLLDGITSAAGLITALIKAATIAGSLLL